MDIIVLPWTTRFSSTLIQSSLLISNKIERDRFEYTRRRMVHQSR